MKFRQTNHLHHIRKAKAVKPSLIYYQFDFEDQHYVVGAVVEDDTINDEARYIYLSKIEGDDFTVEKIAKEFDYNRIANAYLHMED